MISPTQLTNPWKTTESKVNAFQQVDSLKITQGIEDFKKRRFLKGKKDPQPSVCQPLGEAQSQDQVKVGEIPAERETQKVSN